MDEKYIGAADGPPTTDVTPTGGDRATDELLKVPLPDHQQEEGVADAATTAAHEHLSLVTRLAGSEH